jgi:glutaredoxin
MNPEPDIVLFTIPFCPKCTAAKRQISEISEERGGLTVKEVNMLTNMGAALKHGLLTMPAMLVRGKPLKGKVSRQTILDMLLDE